MRVAEGQPGRKKARFDGAAREEKDFLLPCSKEGRKVLDGGEGGFRPTLLTSTTHRGIRSKEKGRDLQIANEGKYRKENSSIIV